MSRLVDNIIAMKILKMLVTPFKDTDAYKMGIVDENGKLLRRSSTFTKESEYDAYDYLTRFVFNIKRLLNKIGKENMLKSVAAALYLIREHEEVLVSELSEENLEDMLHFVLENNLLVESDIQLAENALKEEIVASSAPTTTTQAIPEKTPVISAKNKYKRSSVLRRKKPSEESST